MSIADFSGLTKKRPEKRLVAGKQRISGRNNLGRVTVRHRGGGHKRLLRLVDFKQTEKHGIVGRIAALEYDPNRSARLALEVHPRFGSIKTNFADLETMRDTCALDVADRPAPTIGQAANAAAGAAALAAVTTTGGVSYALAAAHTWYECTHTAGFVPWTPTFAAAWSSEATPLYPEEQYLTSLGLTSVLRGWSLLDVFAVARNTLCAVALGTWRTARTDTGARIVRAYVGPSSILSPQTERLDAAWDGFASLPLHLTRPSSGDTETRA